ncbi:DUF2953 domain-containing protein [Bacillus sp. Marseille-P3661]|uniref:DUF2953 domain-containing protein n=1 Tax=Bacillus sp. Marseille-P3661 TaxID=1936234 RepID=UPI000C8420C1|nr:DUF2953 domain-containing protein [Bacillus sp. Marseille-P3661]
MKWFLIIPLAIIAIILLISIIKLKIKVDILHTLDDDHIKLTVKALFGLITYKYEAPLIKIDKETGSVVVENEQKVGEEEKQKTIRKRKTKITPKETLNGLEKAKDFLQKVVGLHSIVRRMLSHFSVSKFEWKSSIGLGDAAYTGMATGFLWTIKGTVVGVVSQYMKLKARPDLAVTPLFQENFSHTRFIGIFSFRIGYAIVAALSIVRHWKSTKGGQQHVRTSNSGLNDNSYGKLKAND